MSADSQGLLSGGRYEGPLLDGPMARALAGKKIVLTGVTGFIGEQILWKILTDLPDTTAAVLVRRKGSASAYDRMVQLVKKKIFAEVREAAGGAEALLDQRVQVIEGDLPNVPDLPRDLDVLIHCAGDVSFDPPIDQAFKTNVLGTKALLDKLRETCSDAEGNLVRVPHYVHVSTAYTAGRRRGAIPEAAHEHDADYATETEWALKLAERIELESRSPEGLTALREEAEADHRQAGYLTTAADTEKRRKAWVHEQLVSAGTERARSLGWTDVYTFAKAMGERIVADLGRDMEVSIVRPAIVESSLVHPYPGWIEGFKMAEPIILAYGKGNLPEFPASPDSVIDIVPCDHVVNCILAVCATTPEVGRPEFYHVSSGARNPLTFRGVYHHVRRYFDEHPFDRGDRGPTRLPTWSWPGATQIERLLSTSEFASKWADKALSFAPRSRRTRSMARSLDRTRGRLDFLRRYLTIYGEYLRTELHFVDDHALALHRSLDAADVDRWAFDTGVIDWTYYMEEVHCPSVTAPVRRMDAIKRRRQSKGATASTFRELSRATSDPSKVVAVFDLDGTVMSGNVIETYLWARLPELTTSAKLGEITSIVGALPTLLRAERRDRGSFLRAIYRRYAGADLAALEQAVDERISTQILERLSPDAVRRIREHRAAGHTTVLMTGAVRPLTRPLRPLFDVIVAAELDTDAEGRCTGFLTGPPMVGESRSAWLRHWASLNDIDLADSYAYADSHVDLPMLSAVGNPVAVNPDLGLMRAANQNAWSIVEWAAMSQTPRWNLLGKRGGALAGADPASGQSATDRPAGQPASASPSVSKEK